MSPIELTLLWHTIGGAELETALHRWFDSRRTHGEWFDFPGRDAVERVVQALPEIAAAAQREQRERAPQTVRPMKATTGAISMVRAPIDRDRIRELLAEDPGMSAAELARTLGRDNSSGTLRTIVSAIRSEFDTGEDDTEDEDTADAEAAREALAAIAAGEPVVPWEDAKARLDA